MPDELELIGSLVVVSREDCLLLHSELGEIAIQSHWEVQAAKNGYVQCSRCEAWVKGEDFEGHESWCLTHKHKKRKAQKLKSILPPERQSSSSTLSKSAKPAQVFTGRPKQGLAARHSTSLPTTTTTPTTPVHPVQLKLQAHQLSIKQRIDAEIHRISELAWEDVSECTDPDERLRRAKHAALRAIRMLSPTIRNAVEHVFTSQKWLPLINHISRV
jgi:hypothetical protein